MLKYLRVIGIDKLVSVIIPAYNCEKYIKECIASVIGQTYKNTEIIVVDDGSSDKTPEILQKIEGIKVVHRKNGGVSAARNEGLDNATGDYIMFLDSDDCLEANVIETLVLRSLEVDADITRFRLRYFSCSADNITAIEPADFENGFFIGKDGFKKNVYKRMLQGIAFNSVCRNLYKSYVLKNVRFDVIIKTGEDLLFNAKAYTNAKSLLYASDVFYNYRRTATGLTGRGLTVLDKYRYNAMISSELVNNLKLWNMDNLYYRFLAYFRLALITVSKLLRISQNR